MATRKPAAYLLNRAYIQGVPFYVDERVIVPRSFIGELLMTAFAEENALTGDPEAVSRVLDLCTGGGSLAILAARVFPNARIDAVDLFGRRARRRPAQCRGARACRPRGPHRRRSLRSRSRASATISSSPIRPMSTPKRSPVSARICRRAADGACGRATTGSTSCGGSSQGARDHLTPEGRLVCEIGRGRDLLIARLPRSALRLARHGRERGRGLPL